jgi:hypothetical protein
VKSIGFSLKGGCILILTLFFGVLAFATSTTATESPGALKDVRVFSEGGQWHVLLIGSQSMTYKATKTSNPLRVVVDLPNTASKPLIASPVEDNEVIDTVKSSTVIHGPPPLTRVEIVLKRDISYDIRQEEEKIRIIFDKLAPTPEAEGAETGPAIEAKDDIAPATTKESPEVATSESTPEEPRAIPEKTLPSASTILAIEPVEIDKYDVSLLYDPPRLVVDLLGVKSTRVKEDLSLSGPWAKRLRIGQHAEKVRVVFDLRFTPKGELPFQVIVEQNRMVVSLLPGYSLPPQ